jgi:hypothetical protein
MSVQESGWSDADMSLFRNAAKMVSGVKTARELIDYVTPKGSLIPNMDDTRQRARELCLSSRKRESLKQFN